ncbi:MAG: RHS repeat-associated core domain-containing protein, partial [Planctomycetota bacterium]
SYTWSYDNAGRLISEVLDSSDNSVDQTESYVYDLVGNRMRKEVDKPATAYVDSVFAYNYDANDRITSETLDNGVNGAGVDQTTTYGWTQTQQTSKTVSVPSVSSVVQSMSYGLGGQLERVVTTTSNGSGVVTGRTRVDYRYNPQGIRTISVDWTDANLDGTFAAGERTGSVEYLIENANFTGYQQTILETVKNAAGQATKRTSYTFGVDEITQTVSTIDPSSQLITQSSTLTFAHDGHGSVRALFGAAAAIAQVYTYSAYGELLAIHNGSGTLQPLTSSLTSVLYNGEGFDARTGLYNMRARWYSASNARWERLDPFAGNPTDPFSFNKYGFVHGDPVMGTDPTGLVLFDDPSIAGIAAHVAFSGLVQTVRPHADSGLQLGSLFSSLQGTIYGLLKPDVVDSQSKEYFELKPVTHKHRPDLQMQDAAQMSSYDFVLGIGYGYHRGDSDKLLASFYLGTYAPLLITAPDGVYALKFWSADRPMSGGYDGNGFVWYKMQKLPRPPRRIVEPVKEYVREYVRQPVKIEVWDPVYAPVFNAMLQIDSQVALGVAAIGAGGLSILAIASLMSLPSFRFA